MGCCTSKRPTLPSCTHIHPKLPLIDSDFLQRQTLHVIAQVSTPLTSFQQRRYVKALTAPVLKLQENSLYRKRKSRGSG